MGITNLIATGESSQENVRPQELNPAEILHDLALLSKDVKEISEALEKKGLLKPEDEQPASIKIYKGEKRIPVEIAYKQEELNTEYILEITSDTTYVQQRNGRKIMCTYGSRFFDPKDNTFNPAFLNIFVYPKFDAPQNPLQVGFDSITIEEERDGNTTSQVVKKNTYVTGQVTQIPFEEVTELLGIIHTMANPNEVTTIL